MEALVPRHISRNISDVVWKTFKCVSRFYYWLKALKVLNPFYRDIKIDESPEKIKALEELLSKLIFNATIVMDAKEIFND